MRAGTLRRRLAAAMEAAMRSRGPDAIARTVDRAKVAAVAMAGLADDEEVVPAELELSTRAAASVLGFHPEHVRRLVRTGRLPARRVTGDFRILADDLWPLLEARHHHPRPDRTLGASGRADDRAIPSAERGA